MKKYKVFCKADGKGGRWHEYSGIFDTIEEAADCLLIAVDYHAIAVNGKLIKYKVETIETTENASRSAECINYTDIQAEVYEQVKAAKKTGDTEKLNGIRDKYGYDIYKWALDERNNQEENLIAILWAAACSGDIDTLKAYYENGGKIGRRYFKFGIAHSLIAGAFRNGQIDTVKYLQSVGETMEGTAEHEELKALYDGGRMEAKEKRIDDRYILDVCKGKFGSV